MGAATSAPHRSGSRSPARRIKRIAEEGALPVQVITRQDLERQGIVTAEQLIASLSVNGNGLDNLAANADVVSGAARGNNGSTCGQPARPGRASTLVLLNGRRVAAHGLNGGVVDLNSIPMAAVDRIEILKDGASAIYGTDAIGGVINFILRKNFSGLEAQAFTDITEAGGGNIARVKLAGGWATSNATIQRAGGAEPVSENKGCAATSATSSTPSSPAAACRWTPAARRLPRCSRSAALYSAFAATTSTTGRSTGPTLPGGTTQT
jgi:iron complex outermembrane receptor protein